MTIHLDAPVRAPLTTPAGSDPVPQFTEQLKRLSPDEMRFVVEALHDGAVTAQHEAQAYPDDATPCLARARTLEELWNRLLSDINNRGHQAAAS